MKNNAAVEIGKKILIFSLGEPHYALYLSTLERVIRAVEVTPVPNAPPLVAGVINIQGQIIPVLDIRTCFGLPQHEINLDDRFILARTSQRLLALVVDSVSGIHELTDKELVSTVQILPGISYIHGLAKLNDGLILLCDLDQFISAEDEQKLKNALAAGIKKASRQSRSKVNEVS